MGGDQLVPALAGERFEQEHGDEARAAENVLYKELMAETEPLEGAHELVAELKRRGHAVLLASSSKEDDLEHYLDVLGVRDLVDGWTDADDVEASKPEPDIVNAALEKAGSGPDGAVFVGDTRWDVEAAAKAGVPTIAVMTGGWAEQELQDAGAVCGFDSLPALTAALDATPLAGT